MPGYINLDTSTSCAGLCSPRERSHTLPYHLPNQLTNQRKNLCVKEKKISFDRLFPPAGGWHWMSGVWALGGLDCKIGGKGAGQKKATSK